MRLGTFIGMIAPFVFLTFSPNIPVSFAKGHSEDSSTSIQSAESFRKISRQSDLDSLYIDTASLIDEKGGSYIEVTQQPPQQISNQTSETGSDSFSQLSRSSNQSDRGDSLQLPLLP
jgi:hypothetical protein